MLPVRTASPAGVGHRERKLSPCHELPKHTRPRRQERLGDRGNTCASMCTNTLRPVWTDTHGRPRTHPAAAHTAAGVTPTHTSTRAHADTHTCTSSDGLAKPFHLGRLCDLYEDPVGKRGHQALRQTETASQWVVGPGVSKGLSLPHGPLLEHSPRPENGLWQHCTVSLGKNATRKGSWAPFTSGALQGSARRCLRVPSRPPLPAREAVCSISLGANAALQGLAPRREREAPFALISQRPTPPLAIAQQSDGPRTVPSHRQRPVTGHRWPHTPSPGCQQLSVCLRNCGASRAKG